MLKRPRKTEPSALTQNVWEALFAASPSRAQQTQIKIIQATIHLIARDGIQSITFEQVATAAKVSRPLVLRYFGTYEELVYQVARYIRAHFQQFVLGKMTDRRSVIVQITAYVDATFDWIDELPEHAAVWLLFYYECVRNRRFRKLNSELVEMGHARIQALLTLGGESRELKPGGDAKALQIFLTGALVSCLTEDSDRKNMRRFTRRACLEFAGASGNDHPRR